MRVLIVDDEADVREFLTEIVAMDGHEPVVAPDGRTAWELRERDPIRLVVTDWRMPEVDGLELVRRIRAAARVRYTWVIVLTALGGSESYLEGMRAGADDFATKPVTPAELHARLRVGARILALQDDVKLLEGLLHICMYCKKVHAAEGDWTSIERYVEARSEASFSHDVCPRCFEVHVQRDLDDFHRERGAGSGDPPGGPVPRA